MLRGPDAVVKLVINRVIYNTEELFEWAMFLLRQRQGQWLNFLVLEHSAFAVSVNHTYYTKLILVESSQLERDKVTH